MTYGQKKTLRPYQAQALRQFQEHWDNGNQSILYQLYMGGGKTFVAGHVMKLPRFRQVRIFLTHREELLRQAADSLINNFGLECEIVQQSHFSYGPEIAVCSVQTLVSRPKIVNASLIVLDEAHRAKARTWESIIKKYPSAYKLGLSATPKRGDRKALDMFDVMVQGPPPSELELGGYIVPVRLYQQALTQAQVEQLRWQKDKKEFLLRDVNKVVQHEGHTDNLIAAYQKYASGRKMIVFCATVERALAITDAYNAANIPAFHVNGKTDKKKRKALLDTFSKTNQYQIFVNVGIATEGYNNPSVSAIQIDHPIGNLSTYLQMAGRGSRSNPPHKKDYLLLDHGNNILRHGSPNLDRHWTLEGGTVRPHRLFRKTPNGEYIALPPDTKYLSAQQMDLLSETQFIERYGEQLRQQLPMLPKPTQVLEVYHLYLSQLYRHYRLLPSMQQLKQWQKMGQFTEEWLDKEWKAIQVLDSISETA